MRFGSLLCLSCLLASCATPPPEAEVARDEVHELPAREFPTDSAAQREYETATELMQAIGIEVRRDLVRPRGRFPASAKVTVKVVVSSDGKVQRLKVTRSSGYPIVDQSVQRAVMKSEPIPVLASSRETKTPLEFQIVFLPFAK